MQFSMVDMANDATLWGLDTKGHAVRFSDGGWIIDDPALTFTSLTVGSPTAVWGFTSDKRAYQFVYSNLVQLDPSVSMRSISAAADGTVCGVDATGFFRILGSNGKWGGQIGDAILVSAISSNSVVACRPGPHAPGYVELWTGNGWVEAGETSTQLSAGSDGTVWMNSDMQVSSDDGESSKIPMIYAATVDPSNPSSIRNQTPMRNIKLPTTLAVASKSLLWAWYDGDGIYSYNFGAKYADEAWTAVTSSYRMPGLSSDGSAFVLDAKGANILRYEENSGWSSIATPGTVATPPAVRGPSEIYFVTTDGKAFHWQGLYWHEAFPPNCPTPLISISATTDGYVFAVEQNGGLWLTVHPGSWQSADWDIAPSSVPLVQVSAANLDSVYGRDASGKIYKWNKKNAFLSAVTPDPGRPAKYIGAGTDGSVHALFDSPNAGKSDIGHLTNGAWAFVETPQLKQFSVQGDDEIVGVLGSTMDILRDAASSNAQTVPPGTPSLVRKTGTTVYRSK